MIKIEKIRWAGHVVRLGARRGVYRVLVGDPSDRDQLDVTGTDGFHYLLSQWSRVLFGKLNGSQLVKKLMEPEGSLPHSQETATCPYPEPARSNPCLVYIPFPENPG